MIEYYEMVFKGGGQPDCGKIPTVDIRGLIKIFTDDEINAYHEHTTTSLYRN